MRVASLRFNAGRGEAEGMADAMRIALLERIDRRAGDDWSAHVSRQAVLSDLTVSLRSR